MVGGFTIVQVITTNITYYIDGQIIKICTCSISGKTSVINVSSNVYASFKTKQSILSEWQTFIANKLVLVCKQVVRNLSLARFQQVMFAQFVPGLLYDVWNKRFTSYNKSDGIIRLVFKLINNS